MSWNTVENKVVVMVQICGKDVQLTVDSDKSKEKELKETINNINKTFELMENPLPSKERQLMDKELVKVNKKILTLEEKYDKIKKELDELKVERVTINKNIVTLEKEERVDNNTFRNISIENIKEELKSKVELSHLTVEELGLKPQRLTSNKGGRKKYSEEDLQTWSNLKQGGMSWKNLVTHINEEWKDKKDIHGNPIEFNSQHTLRTVVENYEVSNGIRVRKTKEDTNEVVDIVEDVNGDVE